jgi:hypothetical protein
MIKDTKINSSEDRNEAETTNQLHSRGKKDNAS